MPTSQNLSLNCDCMIAKCEGTYFVHGNVSVDRTVAYRSTTKFIRRKDSNLEDNRKNKYGAPRLKDYDCYHSFFMY